MKFALSTRWNAQRHANGEDLVDEILDMGFDALELGYNLRRDLVPGIHNKLNDHAVVVNSVHNYCPVPLSAPRGHPELWTLADHDQRIRRNAVEHTRRTIEFAAEVDAKIVVMHSGNVKMQRFTERLVHLYENDGPYSAAYEKLKMKMQIKRERKVKKQLGYLYRGLELLLPALEATGVCLAIENLPTWESIPTEVELEQLLKTFNHPLLGYWHDTGHAQVRENLGLINHERWLERLQPWLKGMHVHDVAPPACDHLMPPRGKLDFTRLTRFAKLDILRVLEPHHRESREEVELGLKLLKEKWNNKTG